MAPFLCHPSKPAASLPASQRAGQPPTVDRVSSRTQNGTLPNILEVAAQCMTGSQNRGTVVSHSKWCYTGEVPISALNGGTMQSRRYVLTVRFISFTCDVFAVISCHFALLCRELIISTRENLSTIKERNLRVGGGLLASSPSLVVARKER